MAGRTQASPAQDSARPAEIEPLTNRLVVHRLSGALLPLAIRAGVHPNAISVAGLGFGLLAAWFYHHWTDPRMALGGLAAMVAWHVCDGLDGTLARATGRTSALGRLLDGLADYGTFIAVYLSLTFSLANPWLVLPLAVASGIAHALQSAFYEAERATYIRRRRGQFHVPERAAVGGPFERLYNNAEQLLGNRTRPFDERLAAMGPPAAATAAAAWASAAAPRVRFLTLLSANARTVAIFLACITVGPVAFWLYELVALSLLAAAGGIRLRALER
jgi:phosphatidylglycerophosphate synthase